jgi:hypothetical protein
MRGSGIAAWRANDAEPRLDPLLHLIGGRLFINSSRIEEVNTRVRTTIALEPAVELLMFLYIPWRV